MENLKNFENIYKDKAKILTKMKRQMNGQISI